MWRRPLRSFAHRQIDVYERELGWSFWTWKLDQHAETTSESAGLWSFRLVRSSSRAATKGGQGWLTGVVVVVQAVEKGYIDPTEYESDSCMHDPKSDWQVGGTQAGTGGRRWITHGQ